MRPLKTTALFFALLHIAPPAFAGMTRFQILEVVELGRQIGAKDALPIARDIAVVRGERGIISKSVLERGSKERNVSADKLRIALEVVEQSQTKDCYYAVINVSRQGQETGLASALEQIATADADTFKRDELSSLKQRRSVAAAGLKSAVSEAEALCQ